MDPRVWVVLGAVAVSLIATVIVYPLGFDLSPEKPFGAVYWSWVGGLAQFVVIGVVVAIVSLEAPEKKPFEVRARILFRRQSGRHIVYIIERLKSILEHYAETTSVRVIIQTYDDPSKKYLIQTVQETRVRGYIDDIDSTYKTDIDYSSVTLPPAGGSPNKLLYVHVDGRPPLPIPAPYTAPALPLVFTSSITYPVQTKVENDRFCTVEIGIETWVIADSESNTLSCSRYTQSFDLRFVNRTNRAIKIRYLAMGRSATLELPPTDQIKALELHDLEPGVEVCDYYVLAP
jgi:hypothetical protein